jgi:beta-lactamase regulating signal transducer with metallopeptidase domain
MHRIDEWARLGWMQFWQVTLLAAAVYIVVKLFTRHRPHLAYVLWMLVIAKCLTPPIWGSPVGVFSLVQSQRPPNGLASTAMSEAHTPRSPSRQTEAVTRDYEPVWPAIGEEIEAAPEKPQAANLDMRAIAIRALAAAWLAGVLIVVAAVVWKWVALRRYLGCTGTPPSVEICQRAQRLAGQLTLHSMPRLLVIDGQTLPAVFGVLRPTILLPASLVNPAHDADLDPILAHELVHIRRRDPLASRLQLIAQALWWFHPLIWWANREARRERERCCDEAVVAGLNCPPIRYAATLVAVAELAAGARPTAAVAMIGPGEVAAKRLEHITRPTQQFRKRTPHSYLFVTALLAAVILPGAAAGLAPQKSASETGTISITGVCVDSNQQPVAGVDVFLAVHQFPSERAAEPREAHTGADGGFRFDEVAAPFQDLSHRRSRDYTVIGRKLGWATGFVFVHHDWKVGKELTLKMQPPVSLNGRVTDRAGKPLAGATATVPYGSDTPITGIHAARTDDQGRYEISDLAAWNARDTIKSDPKTGTATMVGSIRFPVTLAGYAKTFGDYNRLPATVDVTLEREAAIEGRVIDAATRKPAANVTVSCQGTSKHGWARVTTDDQGRYRMGELVADKYNVWPNLEDRTAVAIDSLPVEPAMTSIAPDLKLIDGGFLEGKVIDVESNKAISKTPEGETFEVAVYGPSHPRSGAGVQAATVDENGYFRLRVAPGVNYPYIMLPDFWKRVQRREEYDRGIAVGEGEIVQLEFRVLPQPPPKNPPMSITRSALPVSEEREAAAAIRRLGGCTRSTTQSTSSR